MEIFGVGILEVILILVVAIIVLGPDGMVKSAQSMGRFMRKIIKSPIWAQLMDTQRELRDMPTRLVREAGLEEDIAEFKRTSQDLKRTSQELRNIDITGGINLKPSGTTPPPKTAKPADSPEAPPAEPEAEDHSIAPPALKEDFEKTEEPPDSEPPTQI